jgi:nucleotide-binding universal stress UspA family protein
MEFKKILTALDEASSSSGHVFERALTEAEKHGASLMLFYCRPQDTLAELEGRVGTVAELDQQDALRKRNHIRGSEQDHARAWLEGLVVRARERGVTAKAAVEVGHEGKQIVEIAEHWGADLIVIGRTQRGSLADCLFGTVSDYVIHRARCSLLLVQ